MGYFGTYHLPPPNTALIERYFEMLGEFEKSLHENQELREKYQRSVDTIDRLLDRLEPSPTCESTEDADLDDKELLEKFAFCVWDEDDMGESPLWAEILRRMSHSGGAKLPHDVSALTPAELLTCYDHIDNFEVGAYLGCRREMLRRMG